MSIFKQMAVLVFCLISLFAKAQQFPADSTYAASFDFVTKAGEPTGTFLYKGTGTNPLVVFAYTDGRKYLGTVTNNRPGYSGMSVVYYPDGTTYIGRTPVPTLSLTAGEQDRELTTAPAAIRYPDGTVFIGNADHNRYRSGFMFAPDGSYIMGGFWWREIFTFNDFKSVYYSKDHKRIAEKYQMKFRGPDLDFDTFIKLEKNAPHPKRWENESVDWQHEHSTNKKSNYDIESWGFHTSKWHITAGYHRSIYRHFTSDTITVLEGFSRETNDHNYTEYTEPGFAAHVKNFNTGAQREQSSVGMVFTPNLDRNNIPVEYPEHFVYNIGDTYTGVSTKANNNGYGIYTFANGSIYYGNFENGHRSGWGTMLYKDGRYHKGMWKDDQKNGPGRLYNKDNEIVEQGNYVGNNRFVPMKSVDLGYYEFIDEFPIAHKIIATALVTNKKLSGAVYTGSIAGNSPEGQGTLVMDDTGVTYAGKWHNGLPDGLFRVTYPTIIKGRDTTDGGTYVGGLKDFHWEGEGKLVLKTLTMYGTFHQGKLNGHGTRSNPGGQVLETGEFVNNVKEGKFRINSASNYDLGYCTYVHGVMNGEAYLMYPGLDKDASGNYVNGKQQGQWTVYARNMRFENGIQISYPSRLGYVTFQNGVAVSQTLDAAAPVNFNRGEEIPICSRCNGTGELGSGKYFMGKEIPMRCPKCLGKGHTWLK